MVLAPLVPSQRFWLAVVLFVGEMTVLQGLLNIGIVCMTIEEAESNSTTNSTSDLSESYYSYWSTGDFFCMVYVHLLKSRKPVC